MTHLPSNLENELLRLVHEKLIEPGAALSEDSDLFSAGLDSMGIMQLMISIEESFGVRVPEHEVTRENFASAHQLAELVRRCASQA
jgi:acyl carrier protein